MKQTKKQQKLVIGRILSENTTLAHRCNVFSQIDDEFYNDLLNFYYAKIVENKIDDDFNVVKYENALDKYREFEKKMKTDKQYARRKIVDFVNNNRIYWLADYNDFDESGYLKKDKKNIINEIPIGCFVYLCGTIKEAIQKLVN